MSLDAESTHPDQNDREHSVPSARDDSPSGGRPPLTTIWLCGLAIAVVGSGMERAADKGWWVTLALAGVLIVILYMWMDHERWLTREYHRRIVSALKRTAALSDSGGAEKEAPRRTVTRRGGKPVEKPAPPSAGDEAARLSEGGVSSHPAELQAAALQEGTSVKATPDQEGTQNGRGRKAEPR